VNKKILVSVLIAFVSFPILALATEYTDTDRTHPKAYVKDSAITVKIKAKLAMEHVASLAKIKVDTDADGVVWLSGTTRTQADIDKAVSVAKGTEGVVDVHNDLKVKMDN